jgi:hypothetical protein
MKMTTHKVQKTASAVAESVQDLPDNPAARLMPSNAEYPAIFHAKASAVAADRWFGGRVKKEFENDFSQLPGDYFPATALKTVVRIDLNRIHENATREMLLLGLSTYVSQSASACKTDVGLVDNWRELFESELNRLVTGDFNKIRATRATGPRATRVETDDELLVTALFTVVNSTRKAKGLAIMKRTEFNELFSSWSEEKQDKNTANKDVQNLWVILKAKRDAALSTSEGEDDQGIDLE